MSELLVAAVAFWYKPDSSHKHLYPTLKDDNDAPVRATSDGEVDYVVDPHGIEVFTTMYADQHSLNCLTMCLLGILWMQRSPPILLCRDGPQGVPSPAEFANDVEDASKPRFDVAANEQLVDKVMELLGDRFTLEHRAAWSRFWSAFPTAMAEIPNERLHPVCVDSIPPCTLRLGDDIRLAAHQVRAPPSAQRAPPSAQCAPPLCAARAPPLRSAQPPSAQRTPPPLRSARLPSAQQAHRHAHTDYKWVRCAAPLRGIHRVCQLRFRDWYTARSAAHCAS